MEGISIRFVDKMGDDNRVWEAAKATMGGGSESNGGSSPSKLINFLAKARHVTPFRHPQVTFECEAPIFVARQLGKHQVGFSWNERSMRYRDSAIGCFFPEKHFKRPENLHDGATQESIDDKVVHEFAGEIVTIRDICRIKMEGDIMFYNNLIEQGMAPEQARMYLPQSMLTRWFWTGSLWGWFEVYRQRIDKHAQGEVQEFARLLDEHMSEHFPIAWDALKSTLGE